MINTSAPTSSTEDEKVEQIYDDTERAMADSGSKYKIITGDFNAEIGTKTKEDFKSLWALGTGESNERGDRSVDFAEEHRMTIANTEVSEAKNRYWTWELRDGETRIRNVHFL